MTTIQAPDRNLLSTTMSAMTPVVTAPSPLIAMPRRQPASRRRTPAHDHARLGEGEGEEHAERVERDEGGHARVEDHQEQGGEAGEGNDPGRERQALSTERELAGHEAVARQERESRGKSAKAVFAARASTSTVATWTRTKKRAIPHQQASDLGQDRLLLGWVGHDPEGAGHEADAEEEGPEDRGRPDERDPRVAPFGRLEGGHAVRDGLDASERRRAGAEGPQDEEDAERLATRLGTEPSRRRGVIGQRPGGQADKADADHGRGSRRCRGTWAP